MKQKLNAKDFILIGALTALMWIICMVISTVMSVAGPVTNVFYPSVVAVPNGIVMMLLLAKVPKKGVFTICRRCDRHSGSQRSRKNDTLISSDRSVKAAARRDII